MNKKPRQIQVGDLVKKRRGSQVGLVRETFPCDGFSDMMVRIAWCNDNSFGNNLRAHWDYEIELVV